jgi:hypothetical protein
MHAAVPLRRTEDPAPAANQSNFTIMPWATFSHLTDEDIRAIYAYLHTLKRVRSSVVIHPPQASN